VAATGVIFNESIHCQFINLREIDLPEPTRSGRRPAVSNADTTPADEMLIGDAGGRGMAVWMSPLLIGLIAPVLAGLFLFPELLRDALGVVGLLLAVALMIALGGYIVSVLLPGAPSALAVRPEARTVAVILRGMLAQREILVPFKDVAKLASAKSFDHDGYERSAVELKTRDGDSWIIPCEIDDAKLAQVRDVISKRTRAR
jgi:hypothetical protein